MFKKTFHWVYGRKSGEQQQVVIGPFSSEMRAVMASEKLDDSEVIPLKTSNQADATRQIKARLFEKESPSLASKVITRFRHPKAQDEEKKEVEGGIPTDIS